MPSASSVVRRVRSGVRRRLDRLLDRLVGPEPTLAPRAPATPPPAEAVAPKEAVEAPRPSSPPEDDTVGAPLLSHPEITREQVERLFEEMVRPALQSDGGDITLVKVESNDVYVELIGACQTCPSSIVTMQQGIQRLLEEEFPQFGRLIRVDG